MEILVKKYLARLLNLSIFFILYLSAISRSSISLKYPRSMSFFSCESTTCGKPPETRYLRSICLIIILFDKISSFDVIDKLLKCKNSINVNGHTWISTCLPVSAVPSSLLNNFADDPETKISALPFS